MIHWREKTINPAQLIANLRPYMKARDLWDSFSLFPCNWGQDSSSPGLRPNRKMGRTSQKAECALANCSHQSQGSCQKEPLGLELGSSENQKPPRSGKLPGQQKWSPTFHWRWQLCPVPCDQSWATARNCGPSLGSAPTSQLSHRTSPGGCRGKAGPCLFGREIIPQRGSKMSMARSREC